MVGLTGVFITISIKVPPVRWSVPGPRAPGGTGKTGRTKFAGPTKDVTVIADRYVWCRKQSGVLVWALVSGSDREREGKEKWHALSAWTWRLTLTRKCSWC